MKRVLQINAVYGRGSTGRIVRDIEAMAEKHGIEAYVAYQMADKLPSRGYRIGSRLDWKLHALFTRVFGRQGYFSRRATKKLCRYIESVKPDVVHLHNLHANYINLGMLLTYLGQRDIATVLTLHDCWFFTGKCFHFVESGCERWKSGCGDCPRNKLDIKSLFTDCTARVHADKKRWFEKIPRLYTVGCSRWISELAKDSLLSSGKVTHIYNGIDTAKFSPRTTDLKSRLGIADKFMAVGAANKWLAPENMPLFDRFLDEREDDEVLVLFGATEEHRSVARGREGVVLLGYQSADGMAELFSAADVFLNPTHADTLPTVNMEALSSGTPVVTYAVCGSPELVADGVTGYSVEEGDTAAMLRAMREIKAGGIDPEACRSYALAHFDKNENYKAYIDLYKNIIQGV